MRYTEPKPGAKGIVHALKYLQINLKAINRINNELLSVTAPTNKLQWSINQATYSPIESIQTRRQICLGLYVLIYWDRVTHICVSKETIVGPDNGLSPGGRHQAIIWTNAGVLLFGSLRTNFSEILIEIHTFSFKKMH